jgi:hypothetical protein
MWSADPRARKPRGGPGGSLTDCVEDYFVAVKLLAFLISEQVRAPSPASPAARAAP